MGKNFLFNKWCWNNWIFPLKRMNLDPYLTPWTKINSKWISDLNVRARTIKFLQENVCRSSWPWICSGFLDMTSKAQEAREKIHKLDFIKLKTSVHQLVLSGKWKKKNPKNGKKVFENHIIDKCLISRICKDYNKKTNSWIQ